VQPAIEVEFHKPLNELSHGEYLIFRVSEDSSPTSRKYVYISLDSQQSGDLFTINFPFAQDMGRIYSYGSTIGFFWPKKGTNGMLFLDLQTQQIRQFNPGCEEYFSPSVPGFLRLADHHFAFSCNENGNQIWHVVSVDDGSITSYIFPATSDYYALVWVSEDLALAFDGISIDVSDHVCLLQISQGLLDCLTEIPYWMVPVTVASPDGKWVIVEYPDPQTPEQDIFGLIPIECLRNPQENCVPTPLPNLANVDNSIWEYLYWLPDGKGILLSQVDCMSNIHETKLWTYDLTSQTTEQIRYYSSSCLYPKFGSWTADNEHFLLIDKNPSDDWKVWLVSTRTGEMQRVASDFKNIIEVVGLIQVP
jgi:hypothetical protein